MRVLVANRGEIAVRLLSGLRTLGHETVAVFSEADQDSPHLREADRAVCIGPAEPAASYLDGSRIIEVARATESNAVHPGYGFLSENPTFAEAVESAGLIFIGPTAASIRAMGDKTEAGRLAREAGVPVVPGFIPEQPSDRAALRRGAKKLGQPLLIKAAAGGGGKGMRIVHHLKELDALVTSASREAQAAFGDGRIFLERYIERARHVEVQVVGDGHGGGLAIGERDCSVQRRHQKLIEECPAPGLGDEDRRRLHEAALALIRHTKYRGAGTVEFIHGDGEFYFLEMNTRLQVEHPVTELVHGVDLLAMQMAVASGEPLAETAPAPRGHAIEVRVYAEDPESGFLPSIGALVEVMWPAGPGVRVDAGVERGSVVSVHYDPLLAKIIASGDDREHAINAMRAALARTFIAGVSTTVAFCRDLLDTREFRNGELSTSFIDDHMDGWTDVEEPPSADPWQEAAACAAMELAGAVSPGDAKPARRPGVFDTLTGWRMSP